MVFDGKDQFIIGRPDIADHFDQSMGQSEDRDFLILPRHAQPGQVGREARILQQRLRHRQHGAAVEQEIARDVSPVNTVFIGGQVEFCPGGELAAERRIHAQRALMNDRRPAWELGGCRWVQWVLRILVASLAGENRLENRPFTDDRPIFNARAGSLNF